VQVEVEAPELAQLPGLGPVPEPVLVLAQVPAQVVVLARVV